MIHMVFSGFILAHPDPSCFHVHISSVSKHLQRTQQPTRLKGENAVEINLDEVLGPRTTDPATNGTDGLPRTYSCIEEDISRRLGL